MKKYTTSVFFILFFIPNILFAVYDAGVTVYNPYGDKPIDPKLYGATVSPEVLSNPPVVPVSTNTTQATINTDTSIVTPPPVSGLKSILNFKKDSLQLSIVGMGKSCLAGKERAVPWGLVEDGKSIDTLEELKFVLNQSVQSDYRLRFIRIKENNQTFSYSMPARLFGVIPVNYQYVFTVDVNTGTFTVKKPLFDRFSTNYYDEVHEFIQGGISQMYQRDFLEYNSTQSIYYRHAFLNYYVSSLFSTIHVYPYFGGLWICIILPYFLFFLLLFVVLCSAIIYLITKRRKNRYVQRFKNNYYQKEKDTKNMYQDDNEDNESLDDYLESKRFK